MQFETSMNRKVFSIFIVYFLVTAVTGLLSCVDCDGPFPDKFKVTSIVWGTYQVTFTKTGSLTLSEITSGVTFDQLGINLGPQTQTFFSSVKYDYTLATGLYACSPPRVVTDEKIVGIEVSANKAFSDQYPQGADLSGLFDVAIAEWERGGLVDRYDLKEYIQTKPFVPQGMTLILKVAPQTTDTFRFTIKYYQDGADLDFAEFTTVDILVMQ